MMDFDLHAQAGSRPLAARATLEVGKVAALVGASGAGKTSLLRLFAGLATPWSGYLRVGDEVWFDAERGINLPPQQRRVGFVFQDYALFPNMSVRQNLTFAQPRPDSRRIDTLLDVVGLTALADRKPAQLSGGQQQRVALARALAREPALLLLDEPLSALDLPLRQSLQGALEALLQEFRVTTVLVSHDLPEVFRLAHTVWQLEDGQLAPLGTPHQAYVANRPAGRFAVQGQLLELTACDGLWLATVAIGKDIASTLLSPDEAAALRPGQAVALHLNGADGTLTALDLGSAAR